MADDHQVSIDLWHRATAAVRERYRASAPALYGAGLHSDPDEYGFAWPEAGIPIPAPRRAPTGDAAARAPREVAAPSR